MSDTPDDVKFLPPDGRLKRKLGGVQLGQILTPEIVASAEQAFTAIAPDLIDESLAHLADLRNALDLAMTAEVPPPSFSDAVIGHSFAIRQKAAAAGYLLVAQLAGSLQAVCETAGYPMLCGHGGKLARWHIDSMKQLLDARISGSGGAVGAAIQTELDRLSTATKISPV